MAAQRQQRQQPRPVRRRRGLRCAGGARPGHARTAARRRPGRASCSGPRRRPTCSRSRARSGATCDRATSIICTRLDHDSNVSPWLQVADDTGAACGWSSSTSPPAGSPSTRLPTLDRPHPLGRGHRRVQRDRHDARHHRHHRRRPRRRRQGRDRWRAPDAARAGRPRRDRLRRVLDELVQVVRPARRDHVDRAGAARPAAAPTRYARLPTPGRASSCSARRRTRRSPRSAPPPSSC